MTTAQKLFGKANHKGSSAPTTPPVQATATSSTATPAAEKYTNKQMLGLLSAKNERFTYAYTKQSDFIILDGETGGVTRIHDIAENPTIKWEIYGGKEFAFLRQKNGKTTVLVKEKAIKAIENLDDINVVEREDGWYMEYTDATGVACEAPLVAKPVKPVRRSTNLF